MNEFQVKQTKQNPSEFIVMEAGQRIKPMTFNDLEIGDRFEFISWWRRRGLPLNLNQFEKTGLHSYSDPTGVEYWMLSLSCKVWGPYWRD
jgi:hypothetical protein